MSLDATIQFSQGVLDLDVDLTVQPGSVLALLGPNGAGKTTILRCLAGLVPIDDGRITIDGTVVDDPSTGSFVEPQRRSVGLVFQDHALFGHLTVLENVAFGLRARNVRAAAARNGAREWIDRVGLSEYSAARPHMLSGGQSQRVALARALVTDPRVLLLDEPLAALDARTRGDVRRDLRRHLSTFAGMSVLVTHDPVDAYTLADHVAVIDGGHVVQSGTFLEVTAHPRSRYVADLVGVNLVQGHVDGGVLVTDLGARVVIADAPTGPAFAVIRPAAITLSRHAPSDVSVQNSFMSTVRDVDRLGERVRVVLDGPLPLVAEISSAAQSSMSLRPGDEIVASAKATDIESFPA